MTMFPIPFTSKGLAPPYRLLLVLGKTLQLCSGIFPYMPRMSRFGFLDLPTLQAFSTVDNYLFWTFPK